MSVVVWRGTKIDRSSCDNFKYAGRWLSYAYIAVLASSVCDGLTSAAQPSHSFLTACIRRLCDKSSFDQPNEDKKPNKAGFYACIRGRKKLQQLQHSITCGFHSQRNCRSCVTLTRARKVFRRRRAPLDKVNIDELEMGSGDILDSSHLPEVLTPGGNNTADTGDPGEVTEILDSGGVTDALIKVTNSTVGVSTTSTILPSSAVEATSNASTAPVVIIPDKSSKPSYVIVTHSEATDATTTHNMTVVENGTVTSSNTGAIVGVIVSLLLIGLIITILIILLKKKRIKMPKKVSVKRKKMVTKMENPQYKGAGKDYRFSRDSTLHIGNTANLTKFNNPNLADTPIPRVLQQESPSTAKRSSLPKSIASLREKKRKAPPPPNPFGDDDELYEKASRGSGDVEMQTFAVRNENASEPVNTDNEQSYPLLKRSASAKEKSKPKDKNDNTNGSTEPRQEADISTDPSESLLPKEESASNDQVSVDITLDDYDMTKNPFFAKA